jgi:hypothetical protein
MNERISELEALCWEDIPCAPYWDGMPGKHELYTTEKVFNKEKFAELIVRECIRCCEGNSEYKNHTDTEWGKGLASGIVLCKEAMKTHFGVEE